ncbi:MAG: hypothetical protein ABJB09_07185 [Verrucomicrobiota bacterium]
MRFDDVEAIIRMLANCKNYWIFGMMNAPTLKPISAQERERWEKHNIETLREWRAIPFEQKIRMIEDMEDFARSMHGGILPAEPPERGRIFPA